MNDVERTLIVEVLIVEQARTMADTWPGGKGMFTIPCYTGAEITHYISTGAIAGTIAQWLPYTDYNVHSSYDEDTGQEGAEAVPVVHGGDLEALVESINLDNPEAGADVPTISLLLEHADISNQSGEKALTRLGLSLTPTEELETEEVENE